MRKRLSVGQRVIYRFYNSVDCRFYGDLYVGVVTFISDQRPFNRIDPRNIKRDLVVTDDLGVEHTLWRKEVKSIL